MRKMKQILCAVLMIGLLASCSSVNNAGNTSVQSGSADSSVQSGEASEPDTANRPLEMPNPSEAGALYQSYFKFGDQVYQFPMSIEDFEKIAGTTCVIHSSISGEQLSEISLEPFETYKGARFTADMSDLKDDTKAFFVYLKNFTEDEIPFSQAQVAGIYITDERLLSELFELPGGITMSSTKDEVLVVYGKPDNIVVSKHEWRKRVTENDKIVHTGIAIRFNDDGRIDSITVGTNIGPVL